MFVSSLKTRWIIVSELGWQIQQHWHWKTASTLLVSLFLWGNIWLKLAHLYVFESCSNKCQIFLCVCGCFPLSVGFWIRTAVLFVCESFVREGSITEEDAHRCHWEPLSSTQAHIIVCWQKISSKYVVIFLIATRSSYGFTCEQVFYPGRMESSSVSCTQAVEFIYAVNHISCFYCIRTN